MTASYHCHCVGIAPTIFSRRRYHLRTSTHVLNNNDCGWINYYEQESAFKSWYLRPRVMKPIGSISTATTLFGQCLSMPIFISSAGVQALVCNEGEIASARAARKVGTIFGLSQHATRSIEHVAQQSSTSTSTFCGVLAGECNNTNFLWYQSYILKDRARTLRLVHRAVRAGYKGIFLTVDSVRFGYREADARNGWNALPPPHRLVNYDDDDDDYEKATDVSVQRNGQRVKSPTANSDESNDTIDTSKIYAGEEGECLHRMHRVHY